jgi:glycosyltransferase involved in cell wall biosynthesis
MNGLASHGVRNTLVCPPDSAIATAADPARVDVHCIPLAGDLDALFGTRLARWLPDAKADLMHVHSRRGADIWGGLAARSGGLPAVLTRRVDNPEVPFLGRAKYAMYSQIIAISQQIQRQLVADGAAADKIQLVYSAIDAASCEPRWTRQQFLECFEFTADNRVVVCAAQMILRKGHANLLNAWVEVARAHPQARLLLLGQGGEESHLRWLVENLRISESVHIAGFRADLRDFLGCADALVHAPSHEGLGVVLLEAQAAGLPVVVTDAGGAAEAVSADETALVVPVDDLEALSSALTRLLEDPQLRERLGAAGALRARQQFAPEVMVNGNLSVYRQLLQDTGRSAGN